MSFPLEEGTTFLIVLPHASASPRNSTGVYKRIADRYPPLPVLFSSGHGDQSAVEGFGPASVGFLRKPYGLAALMQALEAITTSEQHWRLRTAPLKLLPERHGESFRVVVFLPSRCVVTVLTVKLLRRLASLPDASIKQH